MVCVDCVRNWTVVAPVDIGDETALDVGFKNLRCIKKLVSMRICFKNVFSKKYFSFSKFWEVIFFNVNLFEIFPPTWKHFFF